MIGKGFASTRGMERRISENMEMKDFVEIVTVKCLDG